MNKGLKLLAAILMTAGMAHATTLVTVNGVNISDDDVMKSLMIGTQGRYTQLPPEKQKELYQRQVNNMIIQELVYGDAKKEGILKSKEYKEAVAEALKEIERRMAMNIWEKKQFEKITVPEKSIKEYYKSNEPEFMEKERVHARHILVKDEAKANELLKTLKPLSGEKLKNKVMELAKSESTCTSAPQGGDLGTFGKGRMVPEFEQAAFALNKGTITTSPVKSQFGYHIIYLEDKMAPQKLAYDEVRDSIEQRLKYEEFNKVLEAKMKALKDAAKIEYKKQ